MKSAFFLNQLLTEMLCLASSFNNQLWDFCFLCKIEIGQWIQKSVRDMEVSFRDPIYLVFLGSHFGKADVLKATDYSIEKYMLFSVIQDWIK